MLRTTCESTGAACRSLCGAVPACEPRARALRLAARFGALAAVVWSSYTSITAPSSGRARGAWAHWRVLRLEVQLL